MYKKLRAARKLARTRVYETMYIEDDDLDELQIKVDEDISLEPSAIDFGPRFFKPFPASQLAELYKTRWQDDDQPQELPAPCDMLSGNGLLYYFERLLGYDITPSTFAASTSWAIGWVPTQTTDR